MLFENKYLYFENKSNPQKQLLPIFFTGSLKWIWSSEFSQINPGGCVFSSLTQNIRIVHIYLQTNSQIILFVSFQSLNRFLNTLCGNEFYWRLKIYKDFLDFRKISLKCHAYKMLLEQCSNVNKNDNYLHIFKPDIFFTENSKWLYMRNFAKMKKY